MALIPVIFNADDNANSLKGKVTPENLSSFLGILQTREAGILDLFENPIGVTTIVDNTPVGKSTITFREGYISVMGRLIYVQPNTQCQFTLPVAGTETGSFGIQIDLSNTGANEVTWFKSTSTLRTDDIISNSATGVYQFRLYDYTATTSGVTLSNKTTEVIKKMADFLQGPNFETKPVGTRNRSVATTEFVQEAVAESSGISLLATLFTETQAQGTHTWTGAGILIKEKNRYIWQGNLQLKATNNLGNQFNSVNTIRLRIDIDNISLRLKNNNNENRTAICGLKRVLHGGSFNLRTDYQVPALLGIFDNSNANYQLEYLCDAPTKVYYNRPFIANIINVMLELEEL